jgi:dolichol-phosphate mannosyltransferase
LIAIQEKIAVVIPCYRVERHIAKVIRSLPSFIWRIVVVNDASPDDTARVVRQLADPRVILLEHEQNRGVGGAMITGYQACLQLGADIVVKMDGDDQMDPAQLPALLEPLLTRRADYTKGNRWEDQASLRRMPWVRRWGNLGLSFLTKFASGCWGVFDPCNGYTAITADALRRLQFDKIASDYFFEISMLVQLNIHRAVVKDVPMPSRYGDEASSLRVSRVLLHFPRKLVLAACRRTWLRYFVADFSAVSAFLLAGGFLGLIGGTCGAYFWIRSVIEGQAATAGQVMLAAMPLLMSFQLLLQALILDIANQPKRALSRQRSSARALRLRPRSDGEESRAA